MTLLIVDEMHLSIWFKSFPDEGHTYDRSPNTDEPNYINEKDYPQTYLLVCAQVRATTEKLTSVVSKNVMNGLERRLERREKCQGFETFLVGVILLSCVERIIWYLKTLESPRFSAGVSEGFAGIKVPQNTNYLYSSGLLINYWSVTCSKGISSPTSSLHYLRCVKF